jgi:predicted phosphodiesterase
MKIQIYSDIHLEHAHKIPNIPPIADYLFLAGDIGSISKSNFKQFFDYCSKHWNKTFYVLGNHEYWSQTKCFNSMRKEYQSFFQNYSNVILLDDQSYDLVVPGETTIIKIYGTTLWSWIGVDKLKEGLSDFTQIKMRSNVFDTICPIDLGTYNKLNSNSIDKLNHWINSLNKPSTTDNIIVLIMTHFPPLRKNTFQPNFTSNPQYANEPLEIQQYFANDLDKVLNKATELIVDYWISGHTHWSYNFTFGNTKYIANQMGYKSEIGTTQFNPDGIYNI